MYHAHGANGIEAEAADDVPDANVRMMSGDVRERRRHASVPPMAGRTHLDRNAAAIPAASGGPLRKPEGGLLAGLRGVDRPDAWQGGYCRLCAP